MIRVYFPHLPALLEIEAVVELGSVNQIREDRSIFEKDRKSPKLSRCTKYLVTHKLLGTASGCHELIRAARKRQSRVGYCRVSLHPRFGPLLNVKPQK